MENEKEKRAGSPFTLLLVTLGVFVIYYGFIYPLITPRSSPRVAKKTLPSVSHHTCPECCGDKYTPPAESGSAEEDAAESSATGTTTSADSSANAGSTTPDSTIDVPPATGEFSHPEVPAQQIVLENDQIRAAISNVGATLNDVHLKKFRSSQGDPELKLVVSAHKDWRTLMVKDVRERDAACSAVWVVESSPDPKTTVLTYTAPDGLKYTKTIRIDEREHLLHFELKLTNLSGRTLERQLQMCCSAGIDRETIKTPYLRALVAREKENNIWRIDHEVTLDAAKEKPTFDAAADHFWAGVDNKYFGMLWVFDNRVRIGQIANVYFEAFRATDDKETEKREGSQGTSEDKPNCILALAKTTAFSLTEMQKETSFPVKLFVGPKDEDILTKHADLGLDKALSYGTFEFISKILLAVLGAFHAVVRNYGVAIILLTLAVKVALFPLTKKGQVSVHQMQKLQPQVQILKKRYGKDAKKLMEETQKLYRETGVNPFGGCLPLLLQLPVFIGLYRALDLAIALRQAPFVLWVSDLSQPETLFTISGFEVHLLPILMTISWFLQSLLQPKAPDPQMRAQQRMFLIMPLMFGFLLYSMPSGLILYWLTSTALSIGEQFLIKKYFLK
jgi:YidC/Oxa1 family membrane protein insertase